MNKAIFLSVTLVAVALAGCAEEPAYGTFVATTPAADYSTASVSVESTPASSSYPDSDPNSQACGVDDTSPLPEGSGQPECQPATSTVSFLPEGGAVLPAADSNLGYTLWLINANEEEIELGAMEDHGPLDGGNHYNFPTTEFPGEDFTNYKEVQIRFGASVVATQGAALAPVQNFELAEELEALDATVTFDGPQIDVELANIPNGTPLVAWLIKEDVDAETGESLGTYSHSVQFLLGGAQTSYTLTEEEGMVGDYSEFHIHVGASSINVAKSSVIRTIEQ